MKTLTDDDYLLEVRAQIAVRKEDAAAVIALGYGNRQAKDEAEAVTFAVYDLISKVMGKYHDLVAIEHFDSRRIPTLAEFREYINETFRAFQQPGPKLVPKPSEEN
jgi:hypothetical protein